MKKIVLLILFLAAGSLNFSFAQKDTLRLKGNPIAVPDSLSIPDSLAEKTPADTLKPIFQNGFISNNRYGQVVGNRAIHLQDYRYAGNLITGIPFGFIDDLGNLGQPAEAVLFGSGYNNISFMQDGLLLNNRITNSFDLDLIRTEYIDSFEVIPLSRGFLYGSANNPVTINFLTRDKISPRPYSRIRYIQAPNNEAVLDAMFSAYVAHKVNASIGITSKAVDTRYENSDYGEWKASAKIRYMYSNQLNLIGSFSYGYKNVQLFGGVDRDSVNKISVPSEFTDVFYSNLQAPVFYGKISGQTIRYQKISRYGYSLKLLSDAFFGNRSDLTLYHQTSLKEFRLNERSLSDKFPVLFHNNDYNSTGAYFRQNIDLSIIDLNFNLNYEHTEIIAKSLNINKIINSFSAAGAGQINLIDDSFIPSFFVKYAYYNGRQYLGAGGDLQLKKIGNFNLYLGGSIFEKPYNPVETSLANIISNGSVQNVKIIQAVLEYSFKNVYGSAAYFRKNIQNYLEPYIYNYSDNLRINEAGGFIAGKSAQNGINLIFNARFWKFHLSTNSSAYFNQTEDNYFTIPNFTSAGGIYYIDTLFNSNLELKAGVNYLLYGQQDHVVYDFENNLTMRLILNQGSSQTELISNERYGPNIQFDLFMAGTVQKAAIVYFVFENILNNEYYVKPYYPARSRGIRFGISWEFLD